ASIKIDRASGHTGFDTIAMTGAAAEVDLVVQADGLLRTGGDTGVAACAQVKVDRIRLRPGQCEVAEPAVQGLQFPPRTGWRRVCWRPCWPGPRTKRVGSMTSFSRLATRSASSACPMISTRPALL